MEQKKVRIKSAIIFNDSNYDLENCRNGGKYGFNESYIYIGNGRYKVIYGTTSDLEFCDMCGSFGQSCFCEGYETVDEGELMSRINRAELDPSEKVGFKTKYFSGNEKELWIEIIRKGVRDRLNKTTDEEKILKAGILFGISIF